MAVHEILGVSSACFAHGPSSPLSCVFQHLHHCTVLLVIPECAYSLCIKESVSSLAYLMLFIPPSAFAVPLF